MHCLIYVQIITLIQSCSPAESEVLTFPGRISFFFYVSRHTERRFVTSGCLHEQHVPVFFCEVEQTSVAYEF